MKIKFLGAAHEVTGSCTQIEIGGKYILIDCGMEQGPDTYENETISVDASKIDYVFLTHAHVDHSGKLPLLYKNGFRGDIYSTYETFNLCSIMLLDCAHIAESESKYKSRKAQRAGAKEVEPLYTIEDAEGVLKLFHQCKYGEQLLINENIYLRFTDVGHILGSASIELWLKEKTVNKKIVFSGDIGNFNQPIICNPKYIDEADYVVMESTYGDRYHTQRLEKPVEILAKHIDETLGRGGNLIIPSFAVGRTQEILYYIREIKQKAITKNTDFPVYVDSPLANDATSIYLQCDTSCLDDEILEIMKSGSNPLVFENLHTYITTEESKMLNIDKTPKVIISASGMCEAGRVCHHLKYNLWRKECCILFVGYQAAGTLGRTLCDGAKSVRLFGDEIAVCAEIAFLPGVSGHADKDGLIKWISEFKKNPKMVFVNHGNDSACQSFEKYLKEVLGINAFAPYSGTEFDLGKEKFVYIADGIPVKRKKKAVTLLEKLIEKVRELLDVAKKSDGIPNKDVITFTEEVQKLIDKYSR